MAMRKQWFGEAIQDPAYLLIKLCHGAANLFTKSDNSDSMESLTFQNEAIRIINQRLDKSPDTISDATLATVACIVSYEVSETLALDQASFMTKISLPSQ